jgi:hypothetical protein
MNGGNGAFPWRTDHRGPRIDSRPNGCHHHDPCPDRDAAVKPPRRLIRAAISAARQCQLLEMPRTTYCDRPQPEADKNLRLMRVIGETHLA